jgi:hypothetical protein
MLADVMMADEARRITQGFEAPDLIESKALLNAVGPRLAGKPLFLMAGDKPPAIASLGPPLWSSVRREAIVEPGTAGALEIVLGATAARPTRRMR